VLHSIVQCRNHLGYKPNWCCSICGDHFSRRFSANRHIRLKHGGSGQAVPFTHYIAGIRTGIYPPFPRPTFNKTDPSQQIILEEFQREVARDSVKKYLYGSSFTHPKPAFITSRFLPGLPLFLNSDLFPMSSEFNNIPMHTRQVPRLDSDPVFGLAEELCYRCGNFKHIEIRYSRNDRGEINQGHDSCIDGKTDMESSQKQRRDALVHNPTLQRDLLKIFLRPRVDQWTSQSTGILVFKLGIGLDKTTISKGTDNADVTIYPTKESIVELNEANLISYEWLANSLGGRHWNPLSNGDVDSFLDLAGNKTWFYLKLLKDGHQTCYFVILFNHDVNNFPIFADVADDVD
jgi:hypothetical protein